MTSSAGWNSQAFQGRKRISEHGEHLEQVFGGKRANLEAQAAHLTQDTKNALFGVRRFQRFLLQKRSGDEAVTSLVTKDFLPNGCFGGFFGLWPPGCATVFLGVASWQSRDLAACSEVRSPETDPLSWLTPSECANATCAVKTCNSLLLMICGICSRLKLSCELSLQHVFAFRLSCVRFVSDVFRNVFPVPQCQMKRCQQ